MLAMKTVTPGHIEVNADDRSEVLAVIEELDVGVSAGDLVATIADTNGDALTIVDDDGQPMTPGAARADLLALLSTIPE